jgi:DNA-binding transcriptional MerR regulator
MKSKAQKKDAAEYSISQVCKRTGFSADTLRFYEKSGLLPGVMRRCGRRVYSESNLLAVKLIDCLKKTGMPIAEIAEFMRLTTKGDKTVKKRLAMMRKREAAAKAQLAAIQASLAHIEFKVWYYETAAKEGLAVLADIDATLERYRRETGRKFDL